MNSKTSRIPRSVALFIFASISVSCFNTEPSFDEVSRVTSPSGKVDAVLVERNGGATTSFSYEVFVVPKAKSVARRSEIAYLWSCA